MLRGLIFGLIGSIISFVKFRINLKKCLVPDPISTLKTFEYKGKNYDYNSFLKIRTEALSSLSQNQITSCIKEQEKKKSKNKMTVLDEIELSAAKAAFLMSSKELSFESAISHDSENSEAENSVVLNNPKMLTVGKNVPAGRIKFIPTKECGGFINIYPEYPKYDDDFSRRFIRKETTIHLKEGQKILLTNSKIADYE